ncbi:putative translation regulator (Cya5) [Aspergillus saccharolyticus JOP 1030-1]|uniref:Putative translation regulator n=1 Tax=Aspergillus saccharolyticus JOP 1030-1 TaxID=1450539 RepID=A0A318ZA42_9EURO|nr:putative translation regulator [Aspergillus saccharolyticus JOP 1030-1]PYH43307.1 putative translation regulator [Aspergillus saccharolyticus JOP 1030-1]
MLERAAGCLENAGRRFFRDSNGAIRNRRSLYSSLAQYSAANLDLQFGSLINQSPQRPASNDRNATPHVHDTRTPVLDFLYPLSTQEFAASCLLRTQNRLVPRRRRRAAPGLKRAYTSQAASNAPHGSNTSSNERDYEAYDGAWSRYVAAGHPDQVNAALLEFLSASNRIVDFGRSKRVFDRIPLQSRSQEDYLNIIKSAIATKKLLDAKNLCEEAILNGTGIKSWAFLLARFATALRWDRAQVIWDLRSSFLETEGAQLWDALASLLDMSTIEDLLVPLADSIQQQTSSTSLHDFARFLLDNVCTSQAFSEKCSVDSILLILQKYNNIHMVKAAHYIKLLNTLRTSENRQTFVRTIVIYRNYRWRMDGHVPSAKLLGHLVRRLASFEMTAGLLYMLDEFTQFYGKPTLDAYKHAMIAFSKVGDVDTVNDLFDKMVSHHGKPQSRRLVTPLLSVHARVGNVRETLRQFNRVSEEFGLRLNTVCWNILLTAYANAEDLSECFKLLRKMFDEGMEPNSHTFGIVMGICANRGDVQGVRDLLELAKQYRVQITAPLIDTIVEAHCHNQEFEEAESVAKTCLDLDVTGSRVRMWNVLLWNYAFRIDLEAISRVRMLMDEADVLPDGMTYAALMLSLALIGKTENARRILREMHRNNRVYTTEFHYAIILLGYVRSRNRDMVHVIFKEIQERFGEAGLASRLLVLRSQLARDLQIITHGGDAAAEAYTRLEHAERFLEETISEVKTSNLATKSPVLGAGRMSAKQAFPVAYYEHMMNAYGRRGASRRAQELFDEYVQSQPTSSNEDVVEMAPVRLLTALMLAHSKAGEHEKVEEYWNIVFPRAIKMASRPNIESWLPIPASSDEAPLPSSEEVLIVSSQAPRESSSEGAASDTPELSNFSILSAHRFMLSRALSLVIRSLAYRDEISRIPQVILEVEEAGFALTTYNWSAFIQMLACSDHPSDQLEAFTMFEHRFMPNFPGWKYLRRGYGLKPQGVPATIDAVEQPKQKHPPNLLGKEGRRYWSKIQPDFMQPTYVTMVYLAAALNAFRARTIRNGPAELQALFDLAPNTVKAVGEIPYLRDKYQGVLLRQREQRPDKRAPELDHFVWTGGLLGTGGLRRTFSKEGTLDAEVANDAEEAADFEEAIPDIEEFRSLFMRTLERPDEYDMEVEALLNRRRKSSGTKEELDDVGHKIRKPRIRKPRRRIGKDIRDDGKRVKSEDAAADAEYGDEEVDDDVYVGPYTTRHKDVQRGADADDDTYVGRYTRRHKDVEDDDDAEEAYLSELEKRDKIRAMALRERRKLRRRNSGDD